MVRPKSLVIVQPYIPKYRVPFFESLISTLRELNVDCSIAASQPLGDQKSRMDAVDRPWVVPLKQRNLSFAGKSIGLGGAKKSWASADGVIIGLLGSSIDTYLALIESRNRNLRVGVWGHIKPYVQKGHPIDLALERWQLRRASHVFAYTSGGARYAAAAGVAPGRITTVMNSIDTAFLDKAAKRVSQQEIDAFREAYNLPEASTVAFWGGLDGGKRIDFLCKTLDHLWKIAPEIKVLVGGSGSQAHLLHPSIERGQVYYLGIVDQQAQALISKVARAILMPGRIGLIAVDALVLGLPIISTDWPFHSAEIEYLTEGETLFTSPNNELAYAESILQFLSSTETVSRSTSVPQFPTLENMVHNYTTGVIRMLDD